MWSCGHVLNSIVPFFAMWFRVQLNKKLKSHTLNTKTVMHSHFGFMKLTEFPICVCVQIRTHVSLFR